MVDRASPLIVGLNVSIEQQKKTKIINNIKQNTDNNSCQAKERQQQTFSFASGDVRTTRQMTIQVQVFL